MLILCNLVSSTGRSILLVLYCSFMLLISHLQSVARSVGSQIITEEVLASCSGGPRGNEQLRFHSIFIT